MAGLEVSIHSSKYSSEQIESKLSHILVERETWNILQPERKVRVRGMDTTILIAIVGASGTALGTLISGLFQMISDKRAEKIVLRASNGITIEFPANLPPKKLDEMLNKLKELEDNKYQI